MSSSDTETQQPTEEHVPLKMDVSFQSPHACLREVVVTIPQEEVQRYMRKQFDDLVPEAEVPGFRPGRAPRKLVEKQFKKRVLDQVKGNLLMDSLSRVTEEQPFSAISEPNFDFAAIELPEEGDFVFQFTVEVRPEFETPPWQGLDLTSPVEAITDADIDEAIERVLSKHATLEATDEAAQKGDTLLITAVFRDDRRVVSEMDEERITLADRVTFSDAICENFGELMAGAVEGDTRHGKVTISEAVEDESRRGQQLEAEFHVVEVLQKTLPPLTASMLEELGDFQSVEELREFVRSSLQRQVDYRKSQALRDAVCQQLAAGASFELPPDLVQRQTNRELQRRVLELRRSGFPEDEVRRAVNINRHNAQAMTEQALREHFILEQIAEDLQIDAEPADYDAEIELIAMQSDDSPRRVRARLEKSGQMDALRNQIIERKVLDRIVAEANVTDQPVEKNQTEPSEYAIFHNVLGTKDTASIPTALYDESPDDETLK